MMMSDLKPYRVDVRCILSVHIDLKAESEAHAKSLVKEKLNYGVFDEKRGLLSIKDHMLSALGYDDDGIIVQAGWIHV